MLPPHANRDSRQWYQLEKARRRAKLQLRLEPLCRYCQARGIITVATIADHVTPHNGDWNEFWLGALQSLCASCHSGAKRAMELRGYDASKIGDDGWPTDANHPANRRR
jgi:5-methylcytosine-specific restriction endonuclease McrA